MAYCVHLPALVVARLPIFLIYSLLTCCCSKNEEIDETVEAQMITRVIHYDYIEYELGHLHNFQHHPVGRQEMEFNRNLEFTR